jgi:multimeric flavodoxin WrbA
MQVVILNGARPNDAATEGVGQVLMEALAHMDCTVQPFTLRAAKIGYCQGDFECWVKTPGMCKMDDDARTIARAVIASDLVIYLTPVTFGGYSSELKRALDHIICLILPFFTQIDGEVHHQKRYERYPSLIGLGTLPQHDAESERLFATLVKRNAINFHSPAQATHVVVNADYQTLRSDLRALFSTIGLV